MKTEKRIVENDGIKIAYTLQIKQVKNITMRINEDGQLLVTCNAYVPIHKIEALVMKKMKWILSKQQRVMHHYKMHYEHIMLDSVFYLFGKPLQVVRIQSNHNKVRYDDKCFYVYYICEKDAHKCVMQFIKKMCIQNFTPVVDYYYQQLHDYSIPYPKIKFRTMKSRWGSCIPAKEQITLNMRMLHYPKEFMEYVVLHELVHFIQPNHSASFYQIILYHMLDYKNRMKLTK